MLAADLYDINKDYDGSFPRTLAPFKIAFVSGGKAVMDDRLREEYGPSLIGNRPDARAVQEWLSMPLNSVSPARTGLPRLTGHSGEAPPYLIFYCLLERKKAGGKVSTTLTVTAGKSVQNGAVPASASGAVCDLDAKERDFAQARDIKVKINRDRYLTGGRRGSGQHETPCPESAGLRPEAGAIPESQKRESLFSLYVREGALGEDALLTASTFREIASSIFAYVEGRPPLPDSPGPLNVRFNVYVIPTRSCIVEKQDPVTHAEPFRDALGANSTYYPEKATETAKFLSSNEPEFTINCKERGQFYRDLGIGDASLDKIELPAWHYMDISGVSWMFIDMNSPDTVFQQVRLGFLRQLYHVYSKLDRSTAPIRSKARMKIIGMTGSQAQITVAIDQNLTMDQLEELFAGIDSEESIPISAFEIMIPSGSKTTMWADYIFVIRRFLSRTAVPREFFLRFFTRELKKRLPAFLAPRSGPPTRDSPQDFFKKADFMIKYLTPAGGPSDMSTDEESAYNTGRIAKLYVDYKKKNNEENNSLRDILRYPKYDKKHLENVLVRVGRGLELSQADNGEAYSKIKALFPQSEIENDSQDYIYFFYKGYFKGE